MGSTDSNSRKATEMKKTIRRKHKKRPQTSISNRSLSSINKVESRRHSMFIIPAVAVAVKPKSKLHPKSSSVNDTDKLWESFYEAKPIITHKTIPREILYVESDLSDSDTSEFILISSSDEDTETSDDEESKIHSSSETHDGMNEIIEILSFFNICLWNDCKIEDFLTLIGKKQYIVYFKRNAIKPNHLLLIDDTSLKLMNIPLFDRRKILKERDCFIACNKVMQGLLHLDLKHCDRKTLTTLLAESKLTLNKAKALKQYIVVNFIANHMKEIEKQLTSNGKRT